MNSLKQITYIFNKNCRNYHSSRWNNFQSTYDSYQLDSYLSLSLFSYMNNNYPTIQHSNFDSYDRYENDLLSKISYMHIYNYYEEPLVISDNNMSTDEDIYLTEMSHKQSLN
jgi:hypothetical protein